MRPWDALHDTCHAALRGGRWSFRSQKGETSGDSARQCPSGCDQNEKCPTTQGMFESDSLQDRNPVPQMNDG
jgi:hypothetical protein